MKAKRPAQLMWQPSKPPVSNGEFAKFVNEITPERWAEMRLEGEMSVRRAYRRHSSTRAKKMGAGEIERIDRFGVYDRDKGVCHICGGDVPRNDFHLDHVIPLARGGWHVAENLKVAHPMCNLRKGAKLP